MAAVLPFVKNPLVFGPEATRAMSVAFDEVCRTLNVSYTTNGAREAIATRLIELARCGECDSISSATSRRSLSFRCGAAIRSHSD
jgi:hypothetical protein